MLYKTSFSSAVGTFLNVLFFKTLPRTISSFSETLETDPCLVYQFMPNGSVSDRLKCKTGTQPLSWKQGGQMAIGKLLDCLCLALWA